MIFGKRSKQSKVVRRQSQKISRARKKVKEPRPLRRWIFVISVAIFCGAVIYMGVCSPVVSIEKVVVSGAKRIDVAQIENDVRAILSGKLFGCINKDNYFFFSRDHIMEMILADARVKNVNITRVFPDTILIDIEEHDHIVVWCTDNEQKNCYRMDDGCIIAPVDMQEPLITHNAHTIIIGENYGDIAVGDCLMSDGDVDRFLFLGKELVYALDVGITQPYISSTRGSREARYNTDEGWYILADLSYDVHDTVAAASLFKKKVALPSVRNDLAYIDLRFPERIFYKMKDGVIIEDDDKEDDEEDDIDDTKIKKAHD